MNEPTIFRAGDSVGWATDLPEYPAADGWALKYRLLWPAGAAVDIETAGVGEQFTVALASTDTSGWAPGVATLVSWVERSGSKVTLGTRSVTVLPDLTTAANHDSRTRNQKALAAAREALDTYVSSRVHVAEYEIAGRRMKFRAADEIRDLIQFYERECAKENAALAILNGGSPGRVLTRF